MSVVSASEPEEQRMDYGERTTGTRDEHYNLISVLYHALHGAENCDRYAADAEVSGDDRLAAFFREAKTLQGGLPDRAKELLGILEPPPEFGAGAAAGGQDTPARGSTRDVPRPPLGDEPPDLGGIR